MHEPQRFVTVIDGSCAMQILKDAWALRNLTGMYESDIIASLVDSPRHLPAQAVKATEIRSTKDLIDPAKRRREHAQGLKADHPMVGDPRPEVGKLVIRAAQGIDVYLVARGEPTHSLEQGSLCASRREVVVDGDSH
jgi:hypothetical protein